MFLCVLICFMQASYAFHSNDNEFLKESLVLIGFDVFSIFEAWAMSLAS